MGSAFSLPLNGRHIYQEIPSLVNYQKKEKQKLDTILHTSTWLKKSNYTNDVKIKLYKSKYTNYTFIKMHVYKLYKLGEKGNFMI